MNLSRASLISTIAAVITTNFVYAQECQDVEGWRSSDDFGCDWFEENDGCDLYGNDYPDEDGLTAQLACCTCGGGVVDGETYLERCEDISGFLDCHDDPCSWYEEQDIDLDYYDDDEILAGYITRCGLGCGDDNDDVTAQEACCFCGGGEVRSGSASSASASSGSASSASASSASASSASGKSSKSLSAKSTNGSSSSTLESISSSSSSAKSSKSGKSRRM